MKTILLICFSTVALAVFLNAQAPSPIGSPAVPGAALTTPAVAVPSPTGVPQAATSPRDDDDVADSVDRQLNEQFSDSDDRTRHSRKLVEADIDDNSDNFDPSDFLAVPILLIIFCSIFGLPVAIIAVVLYFSFSKNRMMHKTIRQMVEKGQEVPAALLNPGPSRLLVPPEKTASSDLRRGIILVMVGAGIMLFFGAVSGWNGGAWSLGIIPFLIGVGYLLVWKLGTKDDKPAAGI